MDFSEGEFRAPNEVVDEQETLAMAGLSYYFMSVSYLRLRPLRRMLEEPILHAELMTGFGETLAKNLDGTMNDMDAAINSYLKEMARRLAGRKKAPPDSEG